MACLTRIHSQCSCCESLLLPIAMASLLLQSDLLAMTSTARPHGQSWQGTLIIGVNAICGAQAAGTGKQPATFICQLTDSRSQLKASERVTAVICPSPVQLSAKEMFERLSLLGLSQKLADGLQFLSQENYSCKGVCVRSGWPSNEQILPGSAQPHSGPIDISDPMQD